MIHLRPLTNIFIFHNTFCIANSCTQLFVWIVWHGLFNPWWYVHDTNMTNVYFVMKPTFIYLLHAGCHLWTSASKEVAQVTEVVPDVVPENVNENLHTIHTIIRGLEMVVMTGQKCWERALCSTVATLYQTSKCSCDPYNVFYLNPCYTSCIYPPLSHVWILWIF